MLEHNRNHKYKEYRFLAFSSRPCLTIAPLSIWLLAFHSATIRVRMTNFVGEAQKLLDSGQKSCQTCSWTASHLPDLPMAVSFIGLSAWRHLFGSEEVLVISDEGKVWTGGCLTSSCLTGSDETKGNVT